MANDVVSYESSDRIARVTMNRPHKRNALNDSLIEGLKHALRRADRDPNVRVVILSGAGADFCSGADLEALQRISTATVNENLADARSLMELFALIRQLRLPVVAAVKGKALAGGCGLALACDMVMAEAGARFGFPEVKIGFVAAMVLAILRRNVSEKKAFELITLGAAISASEAASLGLINIVSAADAFESTVTVCAEKFANLSPAALSLSKSLLYKTDDLPFEAALESGADVNVIARMSEDVRAGVEKFLARR